MHKPPKIPKFQQVQYQFSAHIRDPENIAMPDDIEQRRMTIYTELFYKNIDNFLSSGFPVLKNITPEKSWHAMVRDFMVKHRSRSPLFNEMAHEFLTYLNNERESSSDPVFIKALCHYEWVELALSTSDSQVCPITFDDQQDYLAIEVKTSPLAWSLSYPFPVHHISPEFQPDEPSDVPVFLLVYRNIDDKVLFLELNPMSAKLIDLLNDGKTGQQAAQQISDELRHPKPDVVIEGARELIHDWIKRSILIYPS